MDIPLFCSTQLHLLAAEHTAEVTTQTALLASKPPKELQTTGLALLGLSMAAQRTGLGGRTVLEFEPDTAVCDKGVFAPHGLRAGDVVRIAEMPAGAARKREKAEMVGRGVEGIVNAANNRRLSVAVSGARGKGAAGEGNDDAGVDALVSSGKRLWAAKLANEVTWRRMVKAVEQLKEIAEKGTAGSLVRVLFGLSKPAPVGAVHDVQWLDDGLNENQRQAVEFALGSKDVALIHGPPGTGKTQTLLEIIRQLVGQGKRVLVCGPSNISVDNIVLRLPSNQPIVRLGHPARLLPGVTERSLDVLSQRSDAGEIAKDVRTELDGVLSRLLGASGKNRLKGKERRDAWDNVKHLRAEFRQRDARTTRELVGGAKVVLATLHGGGSHQIRGEKFDVLIIDEGSQALEAQCWIPLLSSGVPKLILAGDHLQLPPTVKSTDAKPPKIIQPVDKRLRIPVSLEETLFSRLLTLHGEGIKRLLTVQYRMHESIMTFPSSFVYDGRLTAHASVKSRLLSDLPEIAASHKNTPLTTTPVLFIDTQGGSFPESTSSSPSNPHEALLAARHVRTLLAAGLPASKIAVITPYNGQLSALTLLLLDVPGLELGTVDGFQGREKDAVVISLVRSNDKRESGFLNEPRRINVAFTRAMRHLCVIGDAETVVGRAKDGGGGGGGFLREWVKWVENDGGEVEYPDVAEVL